MASIAYTMFLKCLPVKTKERRCAITNVSDEYTALTSREKIMLQLGLIDLANPTMPEIQIEVPRNPFWNAFTGIKVLFEKHLRPVFGVKRR